MLAVIKHVVYDDFVFQQRSAPAHACTKLSTSFLLSYGLQTPRFELIWVQDLRSFIDAYELQVNNIEEVKQRLVEL